MSKRLFLLALAGWCFFATGGNAAEPPQHPRNLILLIGDGMGVTHIGAAAKASGKPLEMERAQVTGLIRTSSANAYVTDSAAAGTALACGVKTKNGSLGLDAEGKRVESILARARKAGKATGIVVSCTVTHATPAAFYAHQPSRNLNEEIAADLLATPPDVVIGGGRRYFEERADGRNLVALLKESGHHFAATLEEAQGTSSGKLLALLTAEHPPSIKAGRGEMLPDAVRVALRLLSENSNGFFLMVEGSQIDWAAHQNDITGVIGETLDFDKAVAIALEYADTHGDTLVIVTADHETGGLSLLSNMGENDWTTGWGTERHSAAMVPVFAHGVGAGAFTGVYENTEIFTRLLKAGGLEPSQASATP